MRFRPWRSLGIIRVCLTVLLLLHLSYLTRFAYVGFDVAPDCPVLGVSSESDCCPVLSGAESACEEAPEGPAGDRGKSRPPTKSSKDCPTCQKFALSGKMALQQLGPTGAFAQPSVELVPSVRVYTYRTSALGFGARAPPAFLS